MTNFKEIDLKKYYYSDNDNILQDFYIPVLQNSIQYDRLAGFFSSTALAIASKGLFGLIDNNGEMRLIISPILEKDDAEIIIHSYRSPEKFIEKKLIQLLEEMELSEEKNIKEHIYILGWMLANKKLEIRLALGKENDYKYLYNFEIVQQGLFHQKVGILKDNEGNIISFSGSINETSSGWLNTIEEFKVFRSWKGVEKEYIDSDIKKFNDYWNDKSKRVRVIELPEAIKMKLIKLAPKNLNELSLRNWYRRKMAKEITFFKHQKQAIESWFINNCNGIFEMATGSGKTITALGCLKKILENNKKLLTVIVCPKQHLIKQWKNEIDKFQIKYDSILIADSSNPNWRDELTNILLDMSLPYKSIKTVILLTTYSTFSSKKFINIIEEHVEEFNTFLIADEVHRVGAPRSKKGLLEKYKFRLGLSATPMRWFDLEGTNIIYEYFNKVVFEFNLENAINTINPVTGRTYLTPFYYFPKFVYLTDEEVEKYSLETNNILKLLFLEKNKDEEQNEILKNIFIRRANIVKNAKNKILAFKDIIFEISNNIEGTIVYCSYKQIDEVVKFLSNEGYSIHRFTEEEDVKNSKQYNGISQREYILKYFGEGRFQILIAMKCLDEGVDVPQAKNAILLSDSGNPLEYIQRIGRVIRRYPDKKEANIFDILIEPNLKKYSEELREIEIKIFEKELIRCKYLSKISKNSAETFELLHKIWEKIWGSK